VKKTESTRHTEISAFKFHFWQIYNLTRFCIHSIINQMKKLFGGLLTLTALLVAFVVAPVVSSINKDANDAAIFAAGQSTDGVRISYSDGTNSTSDLTKGETQAFFPIFGSVATFEINLSGNIITGWEGVNAITLEYAEPTRGGAQPVFEPITHAMTTPDEDGNKAMEIVLDAEIPWFGFVYVQPGFYRVTVRTRDGATPFLDTFTFICISADANFTAGFVGVTTFNSNTNRYNTFQGELNIRVRADAGFYTTESVVPSIIGNVTINDSAVNPYFNITQNSIDSDKGLGATLKIKDGVKKITNGTYVVKFTVEFTFLDIDEDGENVSDTVAGTVDQVTLTVTLTISSPPYVMPTWLTLLLVGAVLGVLGGALYGVNKMVSNSEDGHFIRMQNRADQRAAQEAENLMILREKLKAEEVEAKEAAKVVKSATNLKKKAEKPTAKKSK
jgi:hypothetical protein